MCKSVVSSRVSVLASVAALATVASLAQAAVVVTFDFEDNASQSIYSPVLSSSAPAGTGHGTYVGSTALSGDTGNTIAQFDFNLPMTPDKKFTIHFEVALSQAAIANGQSISMDYWLFTPQSTVFFGNDRLWLESQSQPGWVSWNDVVDYSAVDVTAGQTYVGRLQLKYSNEEKNLVNNYPDPQTLFLDNLTFTAIPEPASLGLLGLGGLAMLRRRRRSH